MSVPIHTLPDEICWMQEEVDFWTSPNPPFENDLDDETIEFLVTTFNLIYDKVQNPPTSSTLPATLGFFLPPPLPQDCS